MRVRFLIEPRQVEFPSSPNVAMGVGQSESQLEQFEGFNIEFYIFVTLIFECVSGSVSEKAWKFGIERDDGEAVQAVIELRQFLMEVVGPNSSDLHD